jgi:hypothetical protein
MVSCANSNIAIQPYDNINHQIQTSPYPWIYLQKSNNINDRNSLFNIFNSLFDTLFENSKPIGDIADYIKNEIERDYNLPTEGKTEEYKEVDIKNFVHEQINKGAEIITAVKVTNVHAEEDTSNNFVTHSDVGEECIYINDSGEKRIKVTSLNAKNEIRC